MAADRSNDEFRLIPDPFLADTTAEGPKLALLVQYLKDLSFEAPHAPEILKHAPQVPQGVVKVDIKANRLPDEGGHTYECVLLLRVEARLEDRIAYIADVQYAGVVRFDNIPGNQLEPSLMVKVPRLLFPFARQIVADMVQAGGFRAMLVNPINFELHYMEQLKARGAGAGPGVLAGVETTGNA
ncbi:MAG: protein-export chaperone SecB [Rhodospirillaceae bacterium]|nr:protein-export chaperone SecB [Rhodospirillaceae bacterium]